MGPVAPFVGYIAAAAAVAGTVISYSQGKKAASAQQQAAEAQKQQDQIQQNMANLQQEKIKREQIASARAARGAVINAGATQGVMGSSGVEGGVSSIGSQLGYNLSYLDTQQSFANQASIFSQQAADYRSKAASYQNSSNMWGTVAGLGMEFGGGAQFKEWGRQIGLKS